MPDSCQTVRFSDVGWTDITATTATASVILEALGYTPETQVLSVTTLLTTQFKNEKQALDNPEDAQQVVGNLTELQERLQRLRLRGHALGFLEEAGAIGRGGEIFVAV